MYKKCKDKYKFFNDILIFYGQVGSDYLILKNKVKQLRKAKRLSQQELSRLANVGQVTISNIETGRFTPRVDVAIRVSQVLGKPVEEIFIIDD